MPEGEGTCQTEVSISSLSLIGAFLHSSAATLYCVPCLVRGHADIN